MSKLGQSQRPVEMILTTQGDKEDSFELISQIEKLELKKKRSLTPAPTPRTKVSPKSRKSVQFDLNISKYSFYQFDKPNQISKELCKRSPKIPQMQQIKPILKQQLGK